MFTKQHFIKIATLIGGLSCEAERENIARKMGDMFKEDNPRFELCKFLKACNVTPKMGDKWWDN